VTLLAIRKNPKITPRIKSQFREAIFISQNILLFWKKVLKKKINSAKTFTIFELFLTIKLVENS